MKVVGQDEIIYAYKNNLLVKLWNLVQYIGFDKIKSPEERKLVFLQSYKKFNPEVNDNFVHFYNNNLHYTMLNKNASKNNILTQDRRAKKSKIEKELDPKIGQQPVNQNENILENFVI